MADHDPKMRQSVAVVNKNGDEVDPIFNHTGGAKTSLTTNATIFTPPAGCYYAQVTTDVDIVINADGAAAVDDGTAAHIVAGLPAVIGVTPAVAVKGLSLSGTATVRVIPYKVRS